MSEVRLTIRDAEQEDSSSMSVSPSSSSKHIVRVEPDVEPVDVRFDNIRISVNVQAKGNDKKSKKKKERKHILRGVSGNLPSGKITAIMGSSGAGKTSLINVIGGRLRDDGQDGRSVSGTLSLNGVSVRAAESAHVMKRLSGLVMQNDVLLPELSVDEQLGFAARMVLPNQGTEEKRRRVDEVLEQLKLVGVRQAQTGMPGTAIRGVSGGERKRISVAQELLRRPAVLILDEPTSGLDSAMALRLMRLLKEIAQSGYTVVLSMHQPSSDVFELADNLILMRAGRIVYSGERDGARHFFAERGYEVPPLYNPADHYVNVLSADDLDENFGIENNNSEDDDNDDDDSDDDDRADAPLERTLSSDVQVRALLQPFRRDRPSFLQRFAYLTARSWRAVTRNSMLVFGKLMQYVMVSVFSTLIFAQLDDSASGIYGKVGALFSNAMLFSFMVASGVVLALPSERAVFLRESVQRLYSPTEYFLAKCVTLLPFDIVFPLISLCITYFAVGLRLTAGAFFQQYVLLFFIASMGSSIGLLVGSLVQDPAAAAELAPSVIVPQMLVAGLFITDMRSYISWTRYISYLYWSFQAAMQVEFGGRDLDERSAIAPTGQGDEVLDFYNIEQSFGAGLGALIGFVILFRIGGLIAFHFISKKQSVEA